MLFTRHIMRNNRPMSARYRTDGRTIGAYAKGTIPQEHPERESGTSAHCALSAGEDLSEDDISRILDSAIECAPTHPPS